jgi:23S rRNA G2445 N2-methylase RlmL
MPKRIDSGFPHDAPLIATATFRLESVVARELEALGYRRALRGWLAFDGDESAVARANLWPAPRIAFFS